MDSDIMVNLFAGSVYKYTNTCGIQRQGICRVLKLTMEPAKKHELIPDDGLSVYTDRKKGIITKLEDGIWKLLTRRYYELFGNNILFSNHSYLEEAS